MQQVMRFDYETDGFGDYLGVRMSDNGDYVYYDDYATLAATVLEQQAEIERLRGYVERTAILAKPSEYNRDEQWMIDSESLKCHMTAIIDDARKALGATQ